MLPGRVFPGLTVSKPSGQEAKQLKSLFTKPDEHYVHRIHPEESTVATSQSEGKAVQNFS